MTINGKNYRNAVGVQHDLTDSYRVEGLLLNTTTTNCVLTNELAEGSGDCGIHPVVLLMMLLADNRTTIHT